MSFDALTLSAVRDELEPALTGARMQKAVFPDELSLAVEAFRKASLGVAERDTQKVAAVRYVAAGACAGCHDNYLAAWAESPHAKAWLALASRDRTDGSNGGTKNPECVACHSTGWGQPGGNASMDDVVMRTWHGVLCEDCHGPLSAHVADPRGSHATRVTEETCFNCHDKANSPQFDYGSYLRRVSCVSQKANETEGPGGKDASPSIHAVDPPALP